MNFNQSVLDYIARTPSIEVVVLASWFAQYMPGNLLLSRAPSSGAVSQIAGSQAIALEGLRRTVESIRSLQKKVIVVAPPPGSGFDVGRCLELRDAGRLVLGADFPSCDISMVGYRTDRAPVLAFLDSVPTDLHAPVVSFDPLLCDPLRCRAELDGAKVYRDTAHFSYDGARAIGTRMQLGAQLLMQAR